jgi:hypothetical protein
MRYTIACACDDEEHELDVDFECGVEPKSLPCGRVISDAEEQEIMIDADQRRRENDADSLVDLWKDDEL